MIELQNGAELVLHLLNNGNVEHARTVRIFAGKINITEAGITIYSGGHIYFYNMRYIQSYTLTLKNKEDENGAKE